MTATAPTRTKRSSSSAALDVNEIRSQVAGLDQTMAGQQLVYLDSAGTSQRALAALSAMDDLHRNYNANIHQEGFDLARQAKKLHDEARTVVAKFVGARKDEEVIWTHGTTEGINLVMTTWGVENVSAEDNIVLTVQEHLSNLLPWQLLSKKTGCELRFIDCDSEGRLQLDNLNELITRRTRLVAINHVSNVLGTINPLEEIAERARGVRAHLLVDGAQSAPHLDIDVYDMECDFFVFSGHKLLGPFGTAALWARADVLEDMPPYNVGGGSVESATLRRARYTDPPKKFEGGTDNPAGAVGMAAALRFLRDTGLRKIYNYEQQLVEHGLEVLMSVPGLRLIGPTTPENRLPLFTFRLEGYDGQELAEKLGNRGIAVSGGSLNAGPLLDRFDLDDATRASCYVYNTIEELDALGAALFELARKRD